ncbi:MAG TPA: hypothetical protein VN328_04430, partial [Thermodesulfovibrionales bacterium]|nr:hypothetical protein [Thermodesulfovibrionales bacterium]
MNRAYKSARYLPVLALVSVWQALSSYGVLPANRLPSPVMIVHGLTELIAEGLPPGYSLAGHCLASLKRVLS